MMNDDELKRLLKPPAMPKDNHEKNFQGIKKQYQHAQQKDDFLMLGAASLFAALLSILGPIFALFQSRKTEKIQTKGTHHE